MKRVYIATALIFISLAGIFAMNTKKEVTPDTTSDIEKLWKDYDASRKADRPQKSLDILSEIKELARKERLPWDFYKAGREFVNTSSERNWKLRAGLDEQFQSEIKQFDEPVLTFFNSIYSQDNGLSIIKGNRTRLEAGHNPGFYPEDGHLMRMDFSNVLVGLIENDYQYALWSTMLGSMYGSRTMFDESRQMLAEALQGKYPGEQLLELVPILCMDDRFRQNEALEKFADSYRTNAVSLLARQSLLENRFLSLSADGKASSGDFKALREEMEAFEKDKKAFASKEKDIAGCCDKVTAFISTLDEKSIYFNVENGNLNVMLRNLDTAELSITGTGKKNLLSRTLRNTVCSYYVLDTIRMSLPEMNDGIYTISCKNGKISAEQIYNRYSISMAQFQDATGHAVFLADALTGEPVKKADLALINDAGKIVTEYKGLNLDGFTYLPKAFVSHFSKDSWKNHLRCSYTDSKGIIHLTQDSRISASNRYEDRIESRSFASIITDRTAFTPGETVSFKVISYYGDRTTELHASPAGKKLNVKLFDVQGKEIASKELVTNEFGSAAGEFVLERRERNGQYRLSVYDDNLSLSSISLRVDDFVLPSFEIAFDKSERYCFPGDEVVVTGTVKSYSGHSLSSADIRYSVKSSYGQKAVEDGRLEVREDGKFTVRFKTERTNNRDFESFIISVKVTDATGETLEWSKEAFVSTSIPLSTRLLNKADARVSDIEVPGVLKEYRPMQVTSDDIFHIAVDLQYEAGRSLTRDGLKITYSLKYGEKTVKEGSASSGDTLALNSSDWPSGIYKLCVTATDTDIYGNSIKSESRLDIIKVKDSDTSLPFDVESIFKIVEGDDIVLQIGSTNGPVWACVELFGEDGRHLASSLVHLDGKKGSEGSLTTVRFAKQADWVGDVSLKAVYFKNYSSYTYSHDFTIPVTSLQLPLSFTRFFDKTAPGAPYSIEISTKPDVECAASIFDKSTETISRNVWQRINLYYKGGFYVNFDYTAGTNSTEGRRVYNMAMATGAMMKSANAAPMMLDAVEEDALYEVEEAAVEYGSAEMPVPSPDGAEVAIRENFANTIAFEPFLRSDRNGRAEIAFTTADKLSTYYVQVFAHDKDMNYNMMRREMTVTIPVKVSLVEPQFLYEGDKYMVKVSLSSSEDTQVRGALRLEFFDGKEYKGVTPVKTLSKEISLHGFESCSEEFEIEVPSVKELGIKVSFISTGTSYGSDAMFVSVPVSKAVQTLTESHSAILHYGESMETLLASLKSQFVNVVGDDAWMKDISILQMVKEAIPSKAEAESDNVIALSEALYVRLLARKLGSDVRTIVSDEELVRKLLACRRPDGGFAWFEGMNSSPVITAALLQRYASLRDRGIISPETASIPAETVSDAVRYLDICRFSDSARPAWCGGLGWEQYVSIRAMFSGVTFETEGIDAKKLKEFRKEVSSFLVPKDERGLNGYILRKARRMQVLLGLSSSDEGRSLAKSWGIKLNTGEKLVSSLEKDLISIEEYAVEHRSGGIYYPNAVMPSRGLLESEAYAHAFITDLLTECSDALERTSKDKGILERADNIADGIRLWLMVQKETQKWGEDAAFVDAITSILDGSKEVLDTRVITLSKSFTKPFKEIRAAGNGFTIERKYFVERSVDGNVKMLELKDGDTLSVGDKVKTEYHIWNEENRSFVKVTAPRMASLRPLEQLSGRYGWWMRPLAVEGWIAFSPSGYRSVLADRTEYWFDSYPEENTVISEEFFVTQSGSFQTPAVEIESLYAPHYRANGDGHQAIVIDD